MHLAPDPSNSTRRAAALALLLLVACGDKARETATGFESGATTGASATSDDTSSSGAVTTSGASASGTTTTTTGATETSAGSSSGATSSSTSSGPKFDLGAQIDIGMMQCIDCSLTIASQQSGTLAVNGPNVFATATLQDQVVYALGTKGAGRFIATADTSLPFNEQTDCPILAWLAGVEPPAAKLFWFGWGPSDGPQQWTYPGTSAGIHLPAEYIGNPAKLAADFDIVMYLEGSGQFDNGDQPADAEMQTLIDYVTIHGGGLYVSSEFAGYLKPADYVSVNRVMVPLGVEALEVNLDWGDVNGQINFDCFPPPPG